MSRHTLERLTAVIRDRLKRYLELDDDAGDTARSEHIAAIADELRASLGEALAEKRVLEREYSSLETEENFDDKASEAIRLGRDDLAKAALARKLELERDRAAVENRIRDLEERAEGLEKSLRLLDENSDNAALTAKLRELDDLVAASKTARNKKR